MTPEQEQNWFDQLPDAFRDLKWDGDDTLPAALLTRDHEAIVWLYRAACLAVEGNFPGRRKGK